jgi:hypothetical protein
LVNLITNAVDAMADVVDRPRVLRIHTSKSNSTTVRVSIEDSGAGLPAENTARIFEPFFTKKIQGNRPGSCDLPVHRRVSWWTSLGIQRQRMRLNLSDPPADTLSGSSSIPVRGDSHSERPLRSK